MKRPVRTGIVNASLRMGVLQRFSVDYGLSALFMGNVVSYIQALINFKLNDPNIVFNVMS